MYSDGFGTPHQLVRIDANCAGNFDELRRVKPTLAKFDLRDKRLTLPYPPTQFFLRHARLLPGLHQKLDHSAI